MRLALIEVLKDFLDHKRLLDREQRSYQDKKDRRIQELSMELEHQDKLCDLYREQLVTLLENVEQQVELLSKKIQVAVNNVKETEAEVQKQPNKH